MPKPSSPLWRCGAPLSGLPLGLSSETVPGNQTETRYYSHYYARRLPAEVLLDAISDATGVPEKFKG